MTTARDYLVSKGLAKPGRGKFSNDAKNELKRAISEGQVFSDWNAYGRVVNVLPAGEPITKAEAVASRPKPRVKTEPVRTENKIKFTKGDRVIVMDMIGPKAVRFTNDWEIERNIPDFLKEFEWTLI